MGTDTSKRTTKKYGWIKDLPLKNKRCFNLQLVNPQTLPPSVDLRPLCPPVYDQGQLGSCTGNGLAGVHEFAQMKEAALDTSLEVFTPSRLFIYYNERKIEDTISSDSGAQIHDGISVLANIGVCSEDDLPYNIKKFTTAPTDAQYASALENKAVTFGAVNQDETTLKQMLASGFPVVFGFTVYESFESEEVASTGVVPMPGMFESVLGGHCVVLVGFSDEKSQWIVRNSWGDSWGDGGYCYFPYSYLIDHQLASDMWAVESVA
jgi:C1A family cysteine protease